MRNADRLLAMLRANISAQGRGDVTFLYIEAARGNALHEVTRNIPYTGQHIKDWFELLETVHEQAIREGTGKQEYADGFEPSDSEDDDDEDALYAEAMSYQLDGDDRVGLEDLLEDREHEHYELKTTGYAYDTHERIRRKTREAPLKHLSLPTYAAGRGSGDDDVDPALLSSMTWTRSLDDDGSVPSTSASSPPLPGGADANDEEGGDGSRARVRSQEDLDETARAREELEPQDFDEGLRVAADYFPVVLQFLFTDDYLIIYNQVGTGRRNRIVQECLRQGLYGPCLLFAYNASTSSIIDLRVNDFEAVQAEALDDAQHDDGVVADMLSDLAFDISQWDFVRRLRNAMGAFLSPRSGSRTE